jgi:ABC-type multidrug transport system ATPase subunit
MRSAQVARSGRVVVLSFHQPSPAMFAMLDAVWLMGAGHIVFSGRCWLGLDLGPRLGFG